MYYYRGKFLFNDPDMVGPITVTNQINSSTCNDAEYFTDDENFANTFESNANINIFDISNYDTRYGNIQSKRSKQVDYSTLANRWNINLVKANKTVIRTTKCVVRGCLYPTLGRRYPTYE